MSNSQTRAWGSISFRAFLVVLKNLLNDGGGAFCGNAVSEGAFSEDISTDVAFLFEDLKRARNLAEIFLMYPLAMLTTMCAVANNEKISCKWSQSGGEECVYLEKVEYDALWTMYGCVRIFKAQQRKPKSNTGVALT